MSKKLTPQSANQIIAEIPGLGILQAAGTTVPADTSTGYATGCLFHKTNGGNGTAVYVNIGTSASADFNALNNA